MPGYRNRAERVSVYSVAIAQKLGLNIDALVSIRVLAEVGALPNLSTELLELRASDDLSKTIVRLASTFDEIRMNNGPEGSAESWLSIEAEKEYAVDLVNALKSVQGIIQPIGS